MKTLRGSLVRWLTLSSLKSAEQEGGYKAEGKTWVPEIESM